MTALVRTPAAPARAPAAGARPKRDAARTQATILAAATREFARTDWAARASTASPRAPEANKRMLYYYFGGKEDLFLAVLERAYEHIRARGAKLCTSRTCAPVEGMRDSSRSRGTTSSRTRSSSRCSTPRTCTAREHLKRSRKIRALHSPLVAMLRDGARCAACATAYSGRGVDPVQLYVSIAALGYFYLSNNHTLSTIFGRDLTAANGARRAAPRARDRPASGHLARR